jgi:hypothetical protein
MNFIQPLMLWGMLGIAIPVFIHIWNKQKGKVIEWAASQWLLDKSEQRHRGLRFDNLLLMLLRCLLIGLMAFLLSKPVLGLFQATALNKIHLIEPQKNVVENYRFELESAIRKGEKVYWINAETREVSDLSKIPAAEAISAFTVQKSINEVGQKGDLQLYLSNRQELARGSAIYVSEHFKLFPVVDTLGKRALHFDGSNIQVLLDYNNPAETQTVHSALKALASVYSFPFVIDLERKNEVKYDWILTDKMPTRLSDKARVILSGFQEKPAAYNPDALYSPEPLMIQTSEMVRSGRLPEWLGQKILEHEALDAARKPLSGKQLSALFIKAGEASGASWERLQKWLFAAFVALLLLERGISLKKMNV